MSRYLPKPRLVSEIEPNAPLILASPFISSLVFENEASDARDHCANERSSASPASVGFPEVADPGCAVDFLSWLRLSMYLCIVSVAVVISFDFKRDPTEIERRLSLPLGMTFWVLSLIALFAGLANYLRTYDLRHAPLLALCPANYRFSAGRIQMYSRKVALVQSGLGTQLALGIVGVVVIATCVLLLSINAQAVNQRVAALRLFLRH